MITTDSDGRLINLVVLEAARGRIQSVSSVVNHDKLTHLGPVADMRGLLRGG